MQGGQQPVYFACPVADFLVFDRVRSSVDLEDIGNFEVRKSLQKVLIVCVCVFYAHISFNHSKLVVYYSEGRGELMWNAL